MDNVSPGSTRFTSDTNNRPEWYIREHVEQYHVANPSPINFPPKCLPLCKNLSSKSVGLVPYQMAFPSLKKPPQIVEMAANGNLIFQDTNKATFVGANSNVVIDTVNASFGVGVDVNGPTSNLHVVGNAYVTSNLEVGTGYSDQLIPRMSGRINNVNITALNERTRTSYSTANNAVSAWTNRSIYTGSKWNSVTWSPELSLFVAVAQTSLLSTPNELVATSPDGITWTSRTIPSSAWRSVTWSPELSLFVAVASSGTNRVATSPVVTLVN